MQKLSINQWDKADRPREKMLAKGIQSLTNAELIAILIGSGNREETAVELSRRILQGAENNLNRLGQQSVTELMRNYKGIGEAKAITIAAALELGRRRKAEETLDRQQISSSRDAFTLFHSIVADLPHEEFWILLLNRASRIISCEKISQGGIGGTVTDVRLIFKVALEKGASSIIACHNHPSGNLTPSTPDKDITRQLSEAGRILQIPLVDHLIVTEKSYFSFADEGLLQ